MTLPGDVHIPGYDLGSEVGRGAYSVVFSAKRQGRQYAIKLPRHDAKRQDAARRLRHEGVTLARLHHPSLPRVAELGEADGTPYLVMELVAGPTLEARLRQGPLAEREALEITSHLARALAVVHGAGLVHCDVKPANIVLGADAPRLVDFGFVRYEDDQGPRAGTPAYLAPELVDDELELDGRTDLFSLGCVLLECLTGRPTGAARELLAAGRERDAARLPELERLDANTLRVLAGLLGRDPRERFGSAKRLLQQLGSETTPQQGDALVGRRRELDALHLAVQTTRSNGGRLVCLSGPSGSGKSRLISQFVTDLASNGSVALFVPSTGKDRGPLLLVRALLDALIDPAAPFAGPELNAKLKRALGEGGNVLACVAPRVAERFGVVDRLPELDEGDALIAESLAGVLVDVVSELGIDVLVVDDFQDLDTPSARVLRYIASLIHAEQLCLVVVGRELNRDEWQAAQPENSWLPLDSLDQHEAEHLIGRFLGAERVSKRVVECVQRWSDGLPLSLLESARSMLDAGALSPSFGQWLVDEDALREMPLRGSARELLKWRMQALSGAARDVLQVVALAGVHARTELVTRVCGSESTARAGFQEAVRFSLANSGTDGVWALSHASVGETLLETLSAEAKSALHARVAEALDSVASEHLAQVPPRKGALPAGLSVAFDELHEAVGLGRSDDAEFWYACADHYAQARLGKHPAAERAALRAAHAALWSFDNERAIQFFAAARESAGGAPQLPAVSYCLGEAHVRRGEFEPALDALKDASSRSKTPILVAYSLLRQAWVQMHKDAKLALPLVQRAFHELGCTPPTRSKLRTLKSIGAWALPRFGRPSAATKDPRRLDALCGLYYLSGRLAFLEGDMARLLQSCFECLPIAEGLPTSNSQIRSYLMGAYVLTALGVKGVGTRYLRRAEELTRVLGDPVVTTSTLQMKAAIAAWAGRIEESLSASDQSLLDMGRWSELTEFCIVTYNQQQIEGLRGRNKAAWHAIEVALNRVTQYDGGPARLDFLGPAARAALISQGRDAEADARLLQLQRLESKGAHTIGPPPYGSLVRVFTETARFDAEFEKLVARFEAEKFNPRRVHLEVTEYYVHLAHARVHQCLRARPHKLPALRGKLATALSDVKKAARIPMLRAHFEVVVAYDLWFAGKVERALKQFQRAEALGLSEAAPWVLYAVHRGRAHIFRERGNTAAADDEARLAAELAREHGAAYRLRWVEEEFGFSGSSSFRSTSSKKSTLSRYAGSPPSDSKVVTTSRIPHAPPTSMQRLEVEMARHDAQRGCLVTFRGGTLELLAASSPELQHLPQHVVELARRADETGRETQRLLALASENIHALAYPLPNDGVVVLERSAKAAPEETAKDEPKRAPRSTQMDAKLDSASRMASWLAHEYNNLLLALSSSAERGDPADIQAVVGAATERARRLTAELSPLSRQGLRSGDERSFSESVAQTLPVITRLLPRRVRLTLVQGEGADPSVRGDSLLPRIVVQLVLHAAELLLDGSLELQTAAAIPPWAANSWGRRPAAVLKVTASGRIDPSAKPGAELMGGDFANWTGRTGSILDVVAGPNTVELWLAVPEPGAVAKPRRFQSGIVSLLTPSVLVVDDDVLVRSSLARLLDGLSYHVLLAANGREALAVAAQNPGGIDLLLTDFSMPELTGLELARELRKTHPDVPVVIMSGYVGDIPEAGELGHEGILLLEKPLSLPTLDRVLKSALARRTAANQNRR